MSRITNEQMRDLLRIVLPFYTRPNRPTEAAIRAILNIVSTNFTLLDAIRHLLLNNMEN